MPTDIGSLLLKASWETIYMVGVSSLLAALAGIPLGVVLVTTRQGHIMENKWFNSFLGSIVNATRSVPFIILMVAIIPLTRLLAGTSIGTNAAIVPLTLSAIPFLGRLVETSLLEIDYGVIEAAKAMGANPWQIVTKVLLPEALSSIVLAVTNLVINLIGYSAMAGAIGGGGIGDLAIRYGYQRFRADIMLITVVILIVQVQVVQVAGDFLARSLSKK